MPKKASGRGVWIAPWLGRNDEIVLLVIDSNRHLVVDPVVIPRGADNIAIGDSLIDMLNRADPQRSAVTTKPPRAQRIGRSRPPWRKLKVVE